MIVEVSKKLSFTDEIYSYMDNNILTSIIYYVIDRRYRSSVNLSKWLRKSIGVEMPIELISTSESLIGASNDNTMVNILRWVKDNIKYTSDKALWDVNEKWQTPLETYNSGKGDCEDGAILMYHMARTCGIPASRLKIWCGGTPLGGHACLMYKPDVFPLNWVMLDWCYYYNNKGVGYRDLFYIHKQDVYQYRKKNNEWTYAVPKQYLDMWFAFNEEKSHRYMIKK